MEKLCCFLLLLHTSLPVLAQFVQHVTHNCKPDQVIIYNLITPEFKCATVCPEIYDFEGPICVCDNNKQCEHLGAKCERIFAIEVIQFVTTCMCNHAYEVVNDDLTKCLKQVHIGEKCETNAQCISYDYQNNREKEVFCSGEGGTCCDNVDYEIEVCIPRVEIDGKCRNDMDCMHRGAVCSEPGDDYYKCQCDPDNSVQVRKGVKNMCECMDGFTRSDGKLWKCLRKAGKLGDVCENSAQCRNLDGLCQTVLYDRVDEEYGLVSCPVPPRLHCPAQPPVQCPPPPPVQSPARNSVQCPAPLPPPKGCNYPPPADCPQFITLKCPAPPPVNCPAPPPIHCPAPPPKSCPAPLPQQCPNQPNPHCPTFPTHDCPEYPPIHCPPPPPFRCPDEPEIKCPPQSLPTCPDKPQTSCPTLTPHQCFNLPPHRCSAPPPTHCPSPPVIECPVPLPNCPDKGRICLAKIIPQSEGCTGTDQYGNVWMAPLSSLTTKPCPFGSTYYEAFWHCNANGTFDGKTPDYRKCTSDWVGNVLFAINGPTLLEFEDAHRLVEDIRKSVTKVLEYSESSPDFYGHELSKLLQGVKTLSQKFIPINGAGADRNLILADSVMQTLSKMLKYEKPWFQLSADKMHRTFSQLVEVYSEVPLNVAANGCSRSNCSFPFRYDNTEIGQSNGATLELTFPLNEQRTKGKNSFFNIKLPQDKAVFYTASGISADFVSAYSSQEFSSHGKRDDSLLTNGDLLIFTTRTTGSYATDGIELSSGPIDLTLLHSRYSWGNEVQDIRRQLHDGETPTAVHGSVQCVFWNAHRSAWSSEGCEVTESSSFSTTCSCNHLSSFTIMMRIHKYMGKSQLLMGLTFAVVILLLIYLFGKILLLKWNLNNNTGEERARFGSEILKNAGLFITVACYGVVFFLADKNFFLFSHVTCYRMGILGHFSVMFMVITLTLQFLINFIEYVSVQKLENLLKVPRVIILIGIPFAVSMATVLITVIVDTQDGPNSKAYGGEFCWLDGTFVYSLFIPMWVLLSFNYYFLVAIFRKALSSDTIITSLTGKEIPIPDVIAFLKSGFLANSAVLTTWLIGFFYMGSQNPIYNKSPSEFVSYLFTFMFVLQAVLMDRLCDKQGLIKWVIKKAMLFIIPLCTKKEKRRSGRIPSTAEEAKNLKSEPKRKVKKPKTPNQNWSKDIASENEEENMPDNKRHVESPSSRVKKYAYVKFAKDGESSVNPGVVNTKVFLGFEVTPLT